MPIINAAASEPIGQSSQSGTRLNGAGGDAPADAPDLGAGALVGDPVPVATVPDEPAVATGDARPAALAGAPDTVEPDLAAVVEEVVVAADVVLVAVCPVVAEPALVGAVPVAPVPDVPPVPVGAVTCAAAGAASMRLSSKARRAGCVMAVKRAVPLSNDERAPRFLDIGRAQIWRNPRTMAR
ncbi:MAG TPA: hypothetical protein VJO12_02130 [Stellaceae bacterium]|nr:hypothetical protein [Stellaceae bacterium]